MQVREVEEHTHLCMAFCFYEGINGGGLMYEPIPDVQVYFLI